MTDDLTALIDEPTINHDEAYELAVMQFQNSNLSRCYLDLVRAVLKSGYADVVRQYMTTPALRALTKETDDGK